jgi:CheY-like chemotaxis protein
MHKILVADDSLTIQKVIKITLANEEFELIECLKSDDINSLVETHSPDIVLLDYNLSEDKTGYELAADILEKKSTIQILMLFGTFDTIDESLMSQSGVKYKIVKPFDGTKFITLCNVMRNGATEKEISQDEEVEDIFADEEEDWVMDSPSSGFDTEDSSVEKDVEDNKSFDSTHSIPRKLDTLQSSIEDWGIDVPGIIGSDESNNIEIPEVIETSSTPEPVSIVNEKLQPSEELLLPRDEDLEYPDMAELKPSLVPLDSLKDEEAEIEIEENFSDKNINLEEEIEDEIDTESLWSADEVEQDEDSFKPLVEDIPRVQPHHLVEVKEDIIDPTLNDSFNDIEFIDGPPSDFPADVMEEQVPLNQEQPDKEKAEKEQYLPQESLEDIIKEKMEPLIQSLVREYCQANIEKIAWEIIPDLAENLIRKEIEKITSSVLESE